MRLIGAIGATEVSTGNYNFGPTYKINYAHTVGKEATLHILH